MRRSLLQFALLALTASTAGAYYHYLHYTNRSFPFSPVPEKFHLEALPNQTVSVFVFDVAATQLAPGENFPSFLNTVREAARVWNGVSTSDLRVAFAGLASPNTPQTAAGIDVVFEEMDPLLLGLGSPTVRGAMITGPTGPFVPIQRSVIRINRDLSVFRSGGSNPSFQEGLFLTVVHEMGHALGLQHTFTSSAMSTDVTRSTTLARPLDADDMAGVSLLYPSAGFAQASGSIYGRITYQGTNQGVHMASVVAIRPDGAAVSTLTDPDGRYRIEGIPPDRYALYVHPLPPSGRPGVAPGDIVLPLDPDSRAVSPGDGFDTVFYNGPQGTRDPAQASYLPVTAGTAFDSVNLSVRRRTASFVPAVTLWSFFGSTSVRPGFSSGGAVMVARGSGLASNNNPTSGLSVSFLGGSPLLAGLRAYNNSDLILDLYGPSMFGGNRPGHLVFSLPNDLHVRPYGLNIVADKPPQVTGAAPGVDGNGTRTLSLTGTDFKAETRFYFDGVQAAVLRADESGRPVVAVPPGVNGVRTSITAFNPDGQNSMFLQSANPVTYTYDAGDPGSISLSPATLTAGGETMVEIAGINTSFQDGLTLVGFGSSDVQVRRLWVLSATRAIANVWVSADAPAGAVMASAITGMQAIAQPFALQIASSNPAAPSLNSRFVNLAAGSSAIYPGATVQLTGINLAGGSVSLADRACSVVSATAREITFLVPSGVPAGPAVLRFSSSVGSAVVALPIDLAPPEIRSVTIGGAPVEASRTAGKGDTLQVIVSGLVENGGPVAANRVIVKIGGVDHSPIEITAGPQASQHQIAVTVASSVISGPQAPLHVWMDGRLSAPYLLSIR